jgi:hypothetical protein
MAPVLSQIIPFYTKPPYFLKMCRNITLPSLWQLLWDGKTFLNNRLFSKYPRHNLCLRISFGGTHFLKKWTSGEIKQQLTPLMLLFVLETGTTPANRRNGERGTVTPQ